MSAFASLEQTMDDYLVKQAPFQIPAGGREWIVKYGPWIAVVLLILMIPAILALFALGAVVGAVSAASGHYLGYFYFPYLIVMFAQLIVLAAAIPKLMKRQKSGWDLLFYYELAGVVLSLVYWLPHPLAVFSLVWSLLGALIGFYILFQIRSYYR